MIDRLVALWGQRAIRMTTALGVVIVLGVWTVAITAIVQFSRPDPAAAGAPAAASRAAGSSVQDLASLATPTPTPVPVGAVVGPVAALVAPLSSTRAGSVPTTALLPAPSAGAGTATATAVSTTATGLGTVIDNAAQTAAQRYGWGAPTKIDTFDDPALPGWERYDGPGHQGKGVRSPNAITAANGILTISGDTVGTTGGMAWGQGQLYGRWEGRMRAPVGDATYHALMLLWPDAENWPVGGEADFVEISDQARRSVDGFLHYGAANNQDSGTVATDAAQWHAWAIEWSPAGIIYFLDGVPWFHVTDASHLPPGPMHLCIQLDWFPEGGGAVTPTEMQVDDVVYYPLTGSGASPVIAPGVGATIAPSTVATIAPGSGTGLTTTTTTSPPTPTTAVAPTPTPAPTTTGAPTATTAPTRTPAPITTPAPTTSASPTTTAAPAPTTTTVPIPTPTPSPGETTKPTDTGSAPPPTPADPTPASVPPTSATPDGATRAATKSPSVDPTSTPSSTTS